SKGSVIDQPYSQAQAEVLETFGAIAQSITAGAGHGYDGAYMDQLISFHAYGDKFTEFNGGQSFDSAGNEHNERQLFGEDLVEDGVIQFAAKEGTLKVAVYYGNVANLTFVSDFILMHKEYGEITVENLITLLFVKTNGKWKMVHEHHSPVGNEDSVEKPALASKVSVSKGSVIDQPYSQAQAEVLETFGAIAQSITAGAGHGYDGAYMDQLISFHAYGDKFTEFNGGQSFDSAGNEHNERQLFGEDLVEDGVIQFAAKEGTLKVAVYYGNVANLTFVSDFILMHKEYGEITVENLITLLFVKTNGKWKIVHEHHSPLKKEES
ncbi:hypothetical protein AB8P51_12430, partial [Muriicola sp. SD30]|uniref:nuclear transport factor 2 family protein n=1 Tax=Muriicola sp. SD30 TaxID=3240936 RepID=UPI00350ED0EE